MGYEESAALAEGLTEGFLPTFTRGLDAKRARAKEERALLRWERGQAAQRAERDRAFLRGVYEFEKQRETAESVRLYQSVVNTANSLTGAARESFLDAYEKNVLPGMPEHTQKLLVPLFHKNARSPQEVNEKAWKKKNPGPGVNPYSPEDEPLKYGVHELGLQAHERRFRKENGYPELPYVSAVTVSDTAHVYQTQDGQYRMINPQNNDLREIAKGIGVPFPAFQANNFVHTTMGDTFQSGGATLQNWTRTDYKESDPKKRKTAGYNVLNVNPDFPVGEPPKAFTAFSSFHATGKGLSLDDKGLETNVGREYNRFLKLRDDMDANAALDMTLGKLVPGYNIGVVNKGKVSNMLWGLLPIATYHPGKNEYIGGCPGSLSSIENSKGEQIPIYYDANTGAYYDVETFQHVGQRAAAIEWVKDVSLGR
jgi:hypothetical protein